MANMYMTIYYCPGLDRRISNTTAIDRNAASQANVVADFNAAETRQLQPVLRVADEQERLTADRAVRANQNPVTETNPRFNYNVCTDVTVAANARAVANNAARTDVGTVANRYCTSETHRSRQRSARVYPLIILPRPMPGVSGARSVGQPPAGPSAANQQVFDDERFGLTMGNRARIDYYRAGAAQG
jgi:hypothetical protein